MTQNEFGERLGVSRDVIGNIEYNRLAKPEQKEPLLKLICREFGVNEMWLRYGEGKMFDEKSEGAKLAEFFAHIMNNENDYSLKLLMQALANLGPEYWEQADKMLKALLDEVKEIQNN